MAQQEQPKDPSTNKGFVFSIFPFGVWLVILLIGLAQNKGFEKIAKSQTATANTDIRAELKACYKQLGLAARGIDQASEKEVNDRLYDCRKELETKS